MSAQHRQSGFTLIELMIAVIIVGALTALLAPHVRRSVLEQRLGAATRDIAAMVRQARLDTATYGRAHLVWITPTDPSGNPAGGVRVLRGRNNSCVGGAWDALDTQCSANTSGRGLGTECYELLLSSSDYALPLTTSLTLEELTRPSDAVSTNPRGVCFAPSGTTYVSNGTALATATFLADGNTLNLGGALLYRITLNRLKAAGTASDPTALPPRYVLVPLSGYAKVLQ
jgi:prepilin-type N-terminal cleavage/methylation domain-containing protein